MSTAAEQLRRVLDLVPRVADDRPHAITDLAQQARVDAQTLVRDLQALATRFDVPGGFVEPLQVYIEADVVELTTVHFLRPMRLTVPELRALELGLAMLAAERPAEEQRTIEGARTRLRAVLARLPAGTGESGDDATLGRASALADASAAGALDAGQRRTLATVRAARRAGRKLRIAYRKPNATAAAERVVCPYALVAARGAWYLVAWCDQSAGVRIFRADRMEHAEATEEPFVVPADFHVETALRDGRVFVAPDGGAGGERLVVRYSPRVARWIAERERGTYEDGGAFVVEHPLADVGWAVRHVLQYGAEAEVLAPLAVREAVRARVEAMAAALGA